MASPSAIAHQWNLKVPITALSVTRNGAWLAVALGDGSLRLLLAQEDVEQPLELPLHNGISLSLRPDADDNSFISGGDDGKVFLIAPGGAPTLLAEHKMKWIDHVASSADGHRAYTAGKLVYLLGEEGDSADPVPITSSAGGLAFSPNGKRLAVSHYDGVSLVWTNAKETAANKLIWRGSHLSTLWTPDGKMLLTALQENALHGWRLADNNEMSMQGYAGKIHSLSFTQKGRYLATSGAEQIICWPFFGGGPWGKTPLTLGGNDGRLVARVASHPKDDLVAAGYDDGMIILAPLDGRMEMMVNQPMAPKGAAVTGLAWNGAGDCLFAGLENGYLLMFTIDSVKRSLAHA